MSESVFAELVDQDAAIAEIQRAAKAARLLVQAQNAGIASRKESAQNRQAADQINQNSQQIGFDAAQKLEQARSVERNQTQTHATGAPNPTATQIQLDTQMSIAAMSHAWLITGPPGSGRSLAARAFAAALECEDIENPGCGHCSACKAVMAGNHPDVAITATDAVTISAQEVRNLVAQAYLAPSSANWRVFIIEDADRMLSRTTNVLLKAIEEPAEHTVWILCTTAPADVLPTIRSRCRNINLVTPSTQAVAALLEKRDRANHDEALLAAQAAQSHIGVARALINDPSAKALRKRTLTALASIRGVGDAVISAKALTDADYMCTPIETDKNQSDESVKNSAQTASVKSAKTSAKTVKAAAKNKLSQAEADELAAEQARIAKMEALGLDPNGKIPAALRTQIGSAADDEKRRKTRAQHDMIDRELIYLSSYFRDVLTQQVGADIALINPDFRSSIEQRAGSTKATQTLKVLDAISEARARLNANVTPQLLLESVLIETFLAAQADH